MGNEQLVHSSSVQLAAHSNQSPVTSIHTYFKYFSHFMNFKYFRSPYSVLRFV